MADGAPVLLLDVMGTLVHDPFFVEVPAFFGCDLQALVVRKHPSAWEQFERGEIDEPELASMFFADGRTLDVAGLKAAMQAAYRFLPGIEALLQELVAAQVPMHVLSNYPHWYRLIEERLALSRYVPWTFVSCETGVRKPEPAAYAGAAATLGVDVGACVFVDDRRVNCEAARQLGMRAVHFRDAATLRHALTEHGVRLPT
ncbi:MAG: HAD-IA family hydrolase [Deltaproteobacteria bacterium]|nr:HAD-IA family hydrolase [Deltaproteobacteria bacterium]MBK8239242.1 HAD-IA family hydrolase [Deltaproteobacteria bacterium]MBK8719682.1 HAD-IA family hydrolase [Deltaproteobacteria bacterium]MBP7289622.1 HAD-IA family hydrolase [Nannocystaceae bacterium]